MAAMTEPDAPAFVPLPDRALIRLDGADWRGLLQGLVTQDVETMAPGEMRYAALLAPQGRLLYDMFVITEGEGAWLEVDAEGRAALLAKLKMYRLRAKVEMAAADGEVAALFGGDADPGEGWRRDPRLPALGWRGVDRASPRGATAAAGGAYDAFRLGLGVADVAKDGLADRVYALEANLDLLNGVDFRKGCFVGQETTSRMKRRNGVRSRLVTIRCEGEPLVSGAEVMAGTLRAGEVRAATQGVALALLRLDRAQGAALSVEGRPVRLDPPDWLAAAVDAPAQAD